MNIEEKLYQLQKANEVLWVIKQAVGRAAIYLEYSKTMSEVCYHESVKYLYKHNCTIAALQRLKQYYNKLITDTALKF